MKVPVSDSVVFFIHIPKCAGSSFGTFIDSILRPRGSFFWHGLDGDLNQMTESKIFFNSESEESLKFIGGHFTISTVNKIIADANIRNSLICSVVRNPVEQAYSYYNWITRISMIKGAPHPLHHICNGMSIKEYLTDSRVLDEISNIQSKYLLGINCSELSDRNVINKLARELHDANDWHVYDVRQIKSLIKDVLLRVHPNYLLFNNLDLPLKRMNVSGIQRDNSFFYEYSDLLEEITWADNILFEVIKAQE